MWKSFLQIMEFVVDHVDGRITYPAFQQELKKRVDELGSNLLKTVVEAVDERLRDQAQERAGWVVTKRNQEKEYLSPFGMVRYQRTYFKHHSGAYRHLADEVVGLTPHARVDPVLKAQLAERAVAMSYGQAGRWSETEAWHVSKQTVMKVVRTVRAPAEKKATETSKR